MPHKFATLKIQNFSTVEIPEDIEEILNLGHSCPIEGIPKKTKILAKFETIFAEWAKYAVSEGLDQYKISEIRAEMYTSFTEFSNCASETSKSENFSNFTKT